MPTHFVSVLRKIEEKTRKLYGTSGGTRTHTLVKEADFESAASTNSATLAIKKWYPEKDSNLQPID